MLLFVKGPNHEIFEHGGFTEIRPTGNDLGTRPKNAKNLWLGLVRKFVLQLRQERVVLDCFFIHFNRSIKIV
jgi:hypothetical protein